MKIITSTGFPYTKGGNHIHAEQQGDDIFVSKELLDAVKKYLIESDRFVVFHHDHVADYSSSDRKDKP